MRHATIDYGYGEAELWGDFGGETREVESFFQLHANQCFGIRKSIMKRDVLLIEEVDRLPEPWDRFAGAATVLKHNGDVIVWNGDGEKIKSEFD